MKLFITITEELVTE
uniref:Uncharacterized protein n=1 Tax=Anguilla anguilla TaxID=7936 RepID=A0A0E9SYP2_ANGAN